MTPTATPLTREELNDLRAARGLKPYNDALIYRPRPLAGPDWDPEAMKKSRARNNSRALARYHARASIRTSSRKRGAP